MSKDTGTKVFATLTTVIGSITVLYSLLGAFGVELTQTQQTAVTGGLGLIITVAGLWLNPLTPQLGEEKKE